MNAELLKKLSRKIAWTPEALVAAGLPPEKVRLMLATGSRAIAERPRVSVQGWKRSEPTRHYVWGPDIRFHLGLDGKTR